MNELNATKAQIVDFIHHNFRRDGKKIPKKTLNSYSDAVLGEIIRKNNSEDSLKAWINRPKMIKFMVEGIQDGVNKSWNCEHPSEEACKAAFEEEKIKVTKIVTAKGNHRCRYCNGIAEGVNKDLLCESCRELFGHSYYSQL